MSFKKSSDDGKEVTPVPIPNTEVKLFSADGSWGFPPVRVGRRFAKSKTTEISVVFLFFKIKLILICATVIADYLVLASVS